MNFQQVTLLLIISHAFIFFLWGKIRYDLVALLALLAAAIFGIIPVNKTFSGFGHPAVFMVISVLIISHALSEVGATEMLSKYLYPFTKTPSLHIFVLCLISAFLSAFMNNIGALALLMPVALQTGVKRGVSAGTLLMPLSFASILGGLMTSIGTPPNIIISKYRYEILDTPFEMFDFTPIGLMVTLCGILFISFIGWRLIPLKKRQQKPPQDLFEIDNYVIQVRPSKSWRFAGKTIQDLEPYLKEGDISVVGLSRNNNAYQSIPQRLPLHTDDILILEGEQKNLSHILTLLDLRVLSTDGKKIDLFRQNDSTLSEVVLSPYSSIIGKEVGKVRLQKRYGLNLLGVSRQGKQHRGRLDKFKLQLGDILLLHGTEESVQEASNTFSFWPLAERGLKFRKSGNILKALGLFALAIFTSITGIVPLHIALPFAAAFMVILKIIPLHKMYEGVDWPIVILIGAMIPIGEALEYTGTSSLLVKGVLHSTASIDPVWAVALTLIVTMSISDILNNAATAVLMAPIAYNLAVELQASPDPFLMAVTIGASSAFLTPIGHQNNALIMGPGGYEFKDYWRMGLPLEILIVLVATPAILHFWPLY